MKIGVIGLGYVGLTTALTFAKLDLKFMGMIRTKINLKN